MDRNDVVRIVEGVLRDISIDVIKGDFTDPNSRKIELRYEGKVFSSAYFDIKEEDEYEG